MQKKQIKVEIYKEGDFQFDGTKLQDLINFFNSMICLAPQEYRDEVEFELEGSLDDCRLACVDLVIYYFRQETDEEYKYRQEIENVRIAKIAQNEIDRAMETLKKHGIEL